HHLTRVVRPTPIACLSREHSLPRTFITLAAISLGVLCGCRNSPSPQMNSPANAQANSSANAQPTNQPSNQVHTPAPSLSGAIANLSIYPVPNNTKDLALTVFLSVGNTGSATVARNWKLDVTTPRSEEH